MEEVGRQQALQVLAGLATQDPIEARIHLDARNFVFRTVCCGSRFGRFDRKPEETMRPEREKIGQVTDSWERRAAEQLDRRGSFVLCEIEFDVLQESRKIGDYQYLFPFISTDEGQHV